MELFTLCVFLINFSMDFFLESAATNYLQLIAFSHAVIPGDQGKKRLTSLANHAKCAGKYLGLLIIITRTMMSFIGQNMRCGEGP
jgi:hypothetical protein